MQRTRTLLVLSLTLPPLAALTGAAMARENRFPAVADLPARPGLPDPLVRLDGRRVTTKEQWTRDRRPELKELFQYYMYGYFPPPRKVEARTRWVNKSAMGGKATLKEVTLSFGPPEMPKISLLVVVPNAHKGRAPVFVGLNFCGNHALVKDP